MIKKILLPLDFSPGFEKAVEVAADMGGRLGAHVDALHVWHPNRRDPRHELLEVKLNLEAEGNFGDLIDQHIVTRLEEVVVRLRGVGVHARGRWEAGEPAATIVNFAVHGGYSAIVMGSVGRAGVKEAFIGSCTERVVRTSPVPVVVVPTQPHLRCATEPRGRWVADEGPLAG